MRFCNYHSKILLPLAIGMYLFFQVICRFTERNEQVGSVMRRIRLSGIMKLERRVFVTLKRSIDIFCLKFVGCGISSAAMSDM